MHYKIIKWYIKKGYKNYLKYIYAYIDEFVCTHVPYREDKKTNIVKYL